MALSLSPCWEYMCLKSHLHVLNSVTWLQGLGQLLGVNKRGDNSPAAAQAAHVQLFSSLRVHSNMAVVVEGGMRAEQLPHQSFVRIVLSPESRVA